MIVIEIDGEYGDNDPLDAGGIHISDDHGEIVMWDSQEWIDEPSVVFVIATAIQEALAEGKHATTAYKLRERMGRVAEDGGFCESHVRCPDHNQMLTCGRLRHASGWHVNVVQHLDPRIDMHRWNDDGSRIEHI